MRILGIDPSVRSTGYGVVEIDRGKIRAVTYGRVVNSPRTNQADCFYAIASKLREVIQTHAPIEAAIEQIIYVQSTRTAIAMGAARGAAMVAIAEAGLPLREYPAKSIKKAVTGTGGAHKNQVGFMMRAMLGLTTTPSSDEGDALAVAMTHAQQRNATKR